MIFLVAIAAPILLAAKLVTGFGIIQAPPPTTTARHTFLLAASSSIAPLTEDAQKLEDILQEKRHGTSKYRKLVVQMAPAVHVSIPEMFGDLPGTYDVEVVVASLKALGFDLVLDTNTAADLTICEEATELLRHLQAKKENDEDDDDDEGDGEIRNNNNNNRPMPLFTSCCPGWLFFLEKSAPELIPYLSTCKSPMMMLGAVVKRNSEVLLGLPSHEILTVAIMPCVAKRQESEQPIFATSKGIRDVDLVITTKELGSMLQRHGIDPRTLEPIPFDSPFQRDSLDDGGHPATSGLGTGAGQLFGTTGGVMEASFRSVYELVTGAKLPRLEVDEVRGFEGLKEANVTLFSNDTGRGIPDVDLRIAVVNGLANAKKFIQKLKQGEVSYDYVEVMACPGGCLGGGGQPKCVDNKITKEQRLQTIYQLDRSLPIRRSHENPDVIRLYEQVLGGAYGSKQAQEQLHVEKQVYGGHDASGS